MDFVTCEPSEQLRFTQTLKNEIKKIDDGKTCTSPKHDSLFKSVIIINNNDESKIVGFKIKTTSPKKYCVRPSYGKILPGKTVEISVTVNIQRDFKLDTKLNDKFLIQTTIIPENIYELSNEIYSKKISEIFSELEILKKTNPSGTSSILKEHKLLCNIEGIVNDEILKRSKKQNENIVIMQTSATQSTTTATSPTATTTNNLISEKTPLIAKNQKTTTTSSNISEKVPSNIAEANMIIKELESAIQEYSVEALKNDLLRRRRIEKNSLNDSTTIDGKTEVNGPEELFFEWKSNQKKYILNRSCQWQMAFVIILVSFILGAYIF